MISGTDNNRTYLGDSVYVENDPGTNMIKLYTNNGFGADQVIYLEPEVWDALVEWKNCNNVIRLRG